MRNRPLPCLVLVACAAAACGSGEPEAAVETVESAPAGVVEVVARDLTLVAPDTIPSGWTTFRFTNTAPMIHFAVVERMPEGHGLTAQQEEVAPLFQEGYELLVAGDVDAATATFESIPPWFAEIVFMGGPGLTAPGGTSEATVYLEPGTYLLECYVKTDGVFHSYNPEPGGVGMVHELIVTDAGNGAPEPEADLRLSISSEDGIAFDQTVAAGTYTIAVDFVDQSVYQNFVGHDVHVVRLSDDVDRTALQDWMNWTRPEGLQTPAPATFVGGTNEMPAGSTAYFTVTFEAGEYAFIAEVPDPAGNGMFLPFTVGAADQS